MALGGWMSGAIFDVTGSYRAAFANGIAWNLLNVSIALWLLLRSGTVAPGSPTTDPARESPHALQAGAFHRANAWHSHQRVASNRGWRAAAVGHVQVQKR
jgi:hypothetical protein